MKAVTSDHIPALSETEETSERAAGGLLSLTRGVLLGSNVVWKKVSQCNLGTIHRFHEFQTVEGVKTSGFRWDL